MSPSYLLAIIQFWEGRQGGGYGSFNYEHYCKVVLAKTNSLIDIDNGKEKEGSSEKEHGENNSEEGNEVIIKKRC